MLCRVSSFTFDTPTVVLFPDAFSKEVLIPTCSLPSEFADTLVASCPEEAFIDLIANSILGATMLSIAVKIHSVSYLQLYRQYCSYLCQLFH